MPAARTPCRAGGELESAEEADDLRLHVVDLRLDHEQALIDGGLRVGVGLDVVVAMEALGGLGEIADLLEDDGLIEDRRRIVRPLLLRFLIELQRADEVVLRVEELAAVEQLE